MKTLSRLPRWVRVTLLGANLLASLGVLASYWVASYPNLIAAWAQASTLAILVPAARAWLEWRLAQHHQAVVDATKEHVDRALGAPPLEGGAQ